MSLNWSRPRGGYEQEPWRVAATGRWDAAKPKKKHKKNVKQQAQVKQPNKHLQHQAIVREGVGPHAGQLFCVECQRHIMWLSRAEYKIAKGS
jgi:hypothetical protein